MIKPILFLSHNRKDKHFVRRLAAALERHGVKVWVDEAELRVGDSLIQKISEGLLGATFLAVVLSPNSVASPWVQRELEIATTREISGRGPRVLAILYKDCELPAFLQSKYYADFRNPKDFQQSLSKILDAVLPEGLIEQILTAVKNAVAAEFWTYRRLPAIDTSKLSKHFTDGSAKARIVHLVNRHARRGWVISNPDNPSACELLKIRLKEIDDDRAIVLTEEYWYLRWYDSNRDKYRFIYNRTNSQTYVLTQGEAGQWLVDANIYQ